MNTDMAQALVAPFPPELVGKLPRITCTECSKASGRCCGQHKKNRCDICSSYITERHIHLDYVGHADVTSRLIAVDPNWTWEPVATDDHGLPLFDTDDKDRPVGLWIRLTVGDVTRLGYGSCEGSQNDAVKVLIGDALRNSAMRFGVAVDLWAKGDRSDPTAENSPTAGGQVKRSRPAPPVNDLSVARAGMLQAAKEVGLGSDPATIGEHFQSAIGKPVPEASIEDIQRFVHLLRTGEAKPQAEPGAA